ncbi:uncharacterized protein JCM6883_004061 [Sporobolomyces salmoneus]|uniref:uncharacterized protein n=1 Tax=Sporobolomyces salmoneus TaxID=183962 RepID=UPI00316B0112
MVSPSSSPYIAAPPMLRNPPPIAQPPVAVTQMTYPSPTGQPFAHSSSQQETIESTEQSEESREAMRLRGGGCCTGCMR